jgi:hypothetical protein
MTTIRRGDIDSEVAVSAWSGEWLDGSGVTRMADWFLASAQGWQISEVFDLDTHFLSAALDVVRTSGHAHPRQDLSRRPPDTTMVVCELNRLRKGRSGPREERIVEHAASVIPCAVGLHAVDIRRPVPEGALVVKRGSQTDSLVRETLVDFRALYAAMPVAWAICSTFGRGPSIAELCKKRGSPAQVGSVYVSKIVPAKEISNALQPASIVDVGAGYEIVLTKLFGGPMETVPNSTYDGLWRILRKASMTGLPWDVLKGFVS